MSSPYRPSKTPMYPYHEHYVVAPDLVDALQELREDPIIINILRRGGNSPSPIGTSTTTPVPSTSTLDNVGYNQSHYEHESWRRKNFGDESPLETLKDELRKFKSDPNMQDVASGVAFNPDRHRTLRTMEELEGERAKLRQQMADILSQFLKEPNDGGDVHGDTRTEVIAEPQQQLSATMNSTISSPPVPPTPADKAENYEKKRRALENPRRRSSMPSESPAPKNPMDPLASTVSSSLYNGQQQQQLLSATIGGGGEGAVPQGSDWMDQERKFLLQEIEHRDKEIGHLLQQVAFRKKLQMEEDSAAAAQRRSEEITTTDQMNRMEHQIAALIAQCEQEKATWKEHSTQRINALEQFVMQRTKAHAMETQRLVQQHQLSLQCEVRKAREAADEYIKNSRVTMRARSEERIQTEQNAAEKWSQQERDLYIKEAENIVKEKVISELKDKFRAEMESRIRNEVALEIKNGLIENSRTFARQQLETEYNVLSARRLLDAEEEMVKEYEKEVKDLKEAHAVEVRVAAHKTKVETEGNLLVALQVQQERFKALQQDVEELQKLKAHRESSEEALMREGTSRQHKAEEELEFERGVARRLAEEVTLLRQEFLAAETQLMKLTTSCPATNDISVQVDFPPAPSEEDLLKVVVNELAEVYQKELKALQRVLEQREVGHHQHQTPKSTTVRTPRLPAALSPR
eukprot:PhF_6_TR35432/c0_g1_i2/m.51631